MTEQRHKVNLGEDGVASLTIDNPILRFWKGIDVYFDFIKVQERI